MLHILLFFALATAHAKQAKLDPETREEMRKRGEMQHVRKSTLLAEQNLARGVEDRCAATSGSPPTRNLLSQISTSPQGGGS